MIMIIIIIIIITRSDHCEVISVGLGFRWRFEKGSRKSYSGSSESEYKNKSS